MTAEGETQPGEAGEAGENPAETFAFAHARYQDTPLRLFDKLRREAQKQSPKPLPDRIKLSSIKLMPELFQPRRGMDDKHVSDLRRRLRNDSDLDPVWVLQVGSRAYLIEGHHRLQAYKEEGKPDIPIKPFKGTIEQAVAFAGRANSRLKLSMTNGERQNYAWRLVRLNEHSITEISEAAGVSPRQVSKMRAAKHKLEHRAHGYGSWREADRAARGLGSRRIDGEQLQEKLTQLAEAHAKRLSKAFGGSLIRNPEVAAWALAIHFDRRFDELLWHLRQLAAEDETEDDEGE